MSASAWLHIVLLIAGLAALWLAPLPAVVHAQDCGVVDSIDYPIDISDSLNSGYDDFSLFRARFGGLHVGLDIGFNRRGEPVRAAARGRVTYSDINGWDTEKGVVIVEHRFPDDSIAYSLYGHMEESGSIRFPLVGTCVTQGDILGVIGWPSRGLPHLHYELRDFMPDDGGPGYTDTNPLELGWYHPLDFTVLWRARLNPATTGYANFSHYPTLPPVLLDTGILAVASADQIYAYAPPQNLLWNIRMDSVVTGLVGLPGGRVVAHSRDGQAIEIRDGRIIAAWTFPGRGEPLIAIGETVIFVGQDASLAAFSPQGVPLWTLEGTGSAGRIAGYQASDTGVMIAHRVGGVTHWRAVSVSGQLVYEADYARSPIFASAPDGWRLVDGMDMTQITAAGDQTIGSLGALPGRGATLTVDALGNSYVYLADRDNTLLAMAPNGEVRWRVRYPFSTQLPPLMAIGGGCLLYTLDDDGMLNVFSTQDGSLVNQLALYAGGVQNRRPSARLLHADAQERLLIGGGFLSMLAANGTVLGGAAYQNCLLG